MRDYEKLVSALREMAEWIGPDDYELPITLYDRLMGAADAIEELSKPKWISAEERLPEPFENVLAANKRGKHYDIDKAWWNGRYFDRCAKGPYRNVTYWMPLPEPPGGDA